jgi:hypothetical protein
MSTHVENMEFILTEQRMMYDDDGGIVSVTSCCKNLRVNMQTKKKKILQPHLPTPRARPTTKAKCDALRNRTSCRGPDHFVLEIRWVCFNIK